MSDSVQPHRWQATRLPRPWDSPGNNTGLGCHFLIQCMKVKSESEVTQSCPTLSDPMDCNLPGSFIHGIFQARVLEWGAIHFSTPILMLLEITTLINTEHWDSLLARFWENKNQTDSSQKEKKEKKQTEILEKLWWCLLIYMVSKTSFWASTD